MLSVFIFVFAIVVNALVVYSLPIESGVQIVNYENTNNGTGDYTFSFETSDGTFRKETGYVVNRGQENEYVSVYGSYGFIGPDGVLKKIHYIADDMGYRIITFKPDMGSYYTGQISPIVVASLLG